MNLPSYKRRFTREVLVGRVGVGGSNPLRIQSMVTSDTMDTAKTVDQVLKLADVGCEIARITAPTVLDAKNLEKIKNELLKKGCDIPLVADIHFRPDAAMVAADFVEKVRINPGNFVDGKAFKTREYTDAQYASEIERIEEKFTPLLLKLQSLKRALRIGTNHGSLSDRIMNRYGDTPLGMVESALEYLRICEKNKFFDIILSMKASNPRVMISAYRLLVERMDSENMHYPLHVGVTEAGDGEDGRIKSAVGIGSLLEDGIGDTIRVSLTEDAWNEIPVCKELASRYASFSNIISNPKESDSVRSFPSSSVSARRESEPVMFGPVSVGGAAPIRVVAAIQLNENAADSLLALIEERVKKDTPPELIEIPYDKEKFDHYYESFWSKVIQETGRIGLVVSFKSDEIPERFKHHCHGYLVRMGDVLNESDILRLNRLIAESRAPLILLASSVSGLFQTIKSLLTDHLVLGLDGALAGSAAGARSMVNHLKNLNKKMPVLLNWPEAIPRLDTAVVLGGLICDGMGDAIFPGNGPVSNASLEFSYNLLQACGSRITKTEFVSCPSCGRTLFDLQSTTERIKSKTGHLKGVKIAIMGCIVNGPGEMADADFGYVGGGPGKINLYVGKDCLEKAIPSDEADEKLIELIKKSGKWVEPPILSTK